ncbi:hypothetical protein AM593_09944, partial [Mytilus galloprovincialis]
MAECQGPALWVYNDAIFEEKDFKNIIELGGKTKILDTEKIGKFGLGFCSVYNVTDVPSFVSKNTLVILDPHLHHLGEAAIGTNPGLRLPLTKSYRKNFPNQFKPYNNIFGCNLEPNNKDDYNNTLFRLPLRTQKQAQESEITDKQYTKREVVELMQIFLHSAANLLLFTQNVKEISVYHLNSESQNPKEDMKLMFQAWKENTEKSVEENEFNILKKVTSAMKGEQTSEIKFPVQIIDIGIEVSSEAHAISKEFHTSRAITSWIISWGTGNKTFELANKLKQQGAIPVGSVAVPIRRDGSKLISFMDMDELPKGFYSKSRMFCFLPLPVEAQLPVHLNGCFMVEQDRKSITRYNQDDKTNDTSYWNDAMLDDVVQSAYINLLTSVAYRSNDPIVETDYWKVWPRMTSMMNLDIHLLTQSFYRSIIMKDDIVFYRRSTGMGSGVKCSLSQALVLEPEFRHSGENGQIAFDCILEFYHGSCFIIDMPLDIYKNFSETPGVDINKLNSRIISKVDFYDQYFFPNLKEDYWQQLNRRKERNRLIIGALDDEDLHYLVERYECIPVQISEELRMPCDLVLETGPVSAMFTVEDERFHDTSFNCYNSILINMGMMEDKISSTLLKERARTVGSLCQETAFARSTAILKYLKEKICLHSDATEDLKNISFLPVLQKIDGWPLHWKADDLEPEEYLFPPSQLFSPNDKFVIGSVGYVLNAENHEQAVLECIGIRTVHIENVVEQINVLANANLHSSAGLEKTCEQLYKRLDEQLRDDFSNLIVVKTLKDFQHKRIVRVESNMVEPIRVAKTVIESCSPFLYEMPGDLQQYTLLWNIVGIPFHFDEKTLTGKLQEQAKLKALQEITLQETHSIINILKNLSTHYPAPPNGMPEEKKKEIFIPDQKRILRPMCDVCYDDPDFHYEDEDVFIVHGDVTQQIIRHLGIMSKRHLYLSRYSYSIPFGQKEKLVTRLKGIIDAYPKDQSVLNELLQNADDAKATEIHFVYDQRQLGTKDVFDKKWKPVQGPALCVFNNSCFTAKDLQGIQNLGEGSKSEDPSKTGQFGVGFNAVYHLTDVPSFLTRGQDTPDGGTFCVFDPHCSYLNVAQPESPGMRLKLDIFQSKYGDVYKGYLQDVVKADTGTWFRLPLRTLEMARMSEISSKSFSERDMKSLLEKMKSQMKTSLLFLSSIKKISISYIKENCNELANTFSVCLSVSDLDIENVKEFSSTVLTESKMIKSKEKTLNQISLKEVRYTATVEDNENNSDIWLIVKTFGFNKGEAVADCVLTAISKGELGFLPRGGTAMKVCTKIMNIQEELPQIYIEKCCDGNAFCFLPLPIRTGLPVHINGHFSVYANRNGLFGGNSEILADDNRTKWNNLLLQQNIAFAYASCLEYAKKMLPFLLNTFNNCEILNSFFACFPEYSNVTDAYWKELPEEENDRLINKQGIQKQEIVLKIECRELEGLPLMANNSEDLTVPSISELSNWCLFPVLWYQEKLVLISFNLAYTVVNYNSFGEQLMEDRNIVSVLKKLSIPSLSSYNKYSKHVGEIVASKQQPEKLARCLIFHKNAFINACLNRDECNRLVTYLATNVGNIGQDVRGNLKNLKIFTSIFGEIVSVDGLRVLVVDTDNSKIVLDGLAEQANRTNTLLLKHNAFHVGLYTALQFKVCQIRPDEHILLEFYRIFVLPNFEFIPRNLHLPHLEFIRDKLITGTTKYLQSELRDLKFIPSLNGDTLQKACDYFSPHHTVFSVLCKPSELPPCPFENWKWKYFMEFAGMKLDLTNAHFLEFAHYIQNQGPAEFSENLMTKIYDYIEALPMQTIVEMKPQLSETPFIHIVDKETFIKVRNVIIIGDKSSEIPPYLLVASEIYGKYFTLFRTLGAKDKADLNHYIRVLASIKGEVGEKTLVARELKCTEAAVQGALSVLKRLSDAPQVEESVFYLLSSEEKLFPSHELVYPDRPWKHRLKNQNDIKFLKSMDQFKDAGFNVYNCLSLLPDTMQLKKLSKVVMEKLLTDQNRIPWEVAQTLESFLSGESFLYAIKRLVKTQKKKEGNKEIDECSLEIISSNIRTVRVVALQDLKTVLVYRNEHLTSSSMKKTLYHNREENIVYVEKVNLDMGMWLKNTLYQVASVIKRLCMDQVEKDKLQMVLLQYDNNFEEMKKLLDVLKAVPLDFKARYTSWVPLPGTPVPLDCLDSLVQDLVKFSPGDYAVYQIFDNIDEDEDDQNKARIYIYVTAGQFPLYKVDVGEEQTEDVHSFLLFQIDRKKNQEMGLELHTHGHAGHNIGDKYKIKQQIEETLVDAWRLGLDKFKKIYKRLLLQWHPDKNYNSEFCCEITKHIIDFTNRLMSGEIDVSSIPQYRERRGNSSGGNWQSYNDCWNEHVHRARRTPHDSTREECYTFDANGYADRVRHRHRGRQRNHTHYSPTEYHPDPQPQMGRIWLKQAKNDISAARSFLTTATEQSYNWVCVISQQAAEKALKAIQVCEDAKRVSNYHSLITSVCLKNPTLKQAAEELERCIGDYSKLRYPRPVFYPNTPSDLYSHEDAVETIKWAEIIVSTVDDMM